MTTDSATTRLLYAIISQKCLKDIDWNKVAADPILAQEITNGHAARMRYSRFKKQMEGTTGVRKPRNPASPRKNRVEKNKSPKKATEQRPHEEEAILKREAEAQPPSQPPNAEATPEAGEVGVQGLGLGMPDRNHSPIIKHEPGLAQYPMTPGSQTQTPSPSFHGAGEMDHMYASFDMPYDSPGQGYGMMVQDPFQGLWNGHPHGHQHGNGDGAVMVKREERWDDAYRLDQV